MKTEKTFSSTFWLIAAAILFLIFTTEATFAGQRATNYLAGNFKGGDTVTNVAVPVGTRVTKVTMSFGERQNGIVLESSDGSSVSFSGRKKAPVTKSVTFGEGEYLVGFHGQYIDDPKVRQKGWVRIWVITNLNPDGYGPFGQGEGKPFRITALSGSHVVGLHGRTGNVIDCAGLITEVR